MEERRPFCSEVSYDNDEPLGATASRIDHWILVEYRGLWGRDTLGATGLGAPLKAHLEEQVRARPSSRLLFVRRPDRRACPTLVAFAVDSREDHARIERIDFEHHDDLLRVDFGEPRGRRLDHPVFVVCTHGKHDRCCARYGRPLFDALEGELDDEWLWQSTHVGGDRFAGNLVCLPEGVYYGRVDRETASAVLDEHLAGRIHLPAYRGRSTYSMAVQAADRAIREQHGLTRIAALRLRAVEETGTARWRVTLSEYQAEVHVEEGDLTFLTCGSETLRRPRRFVGGAVSVLPAA